MKAIKDMIFGYVIPAVVISIIILLFCIIFNLGESLDRDLGFNDRVY